jgi:hypothetical protein
LPEIDNGYAFYSKARPSLFLSIVTFSLVFLEFMLLFPCFCCFRHQAVHHAEQKEKGFLIDPFSGNPFPLGAPPTDPLFLKEFETSFLPRLPSSSSSSSPVVFGSRWLTEMKRREKEEKDARYFDGYSAYRSPVSSTSSSVMVRRSIFPFRSHSCLILFLSLSSAFLPSSR